MIDLNGCAIILLCVCIGSLISTVAKLSVKSEQNQAEIETHENCLNDDDYFGVSKLFTKRQLMDNLVHMGHKTGTWNPLMKPYILGERLGFHIIDLDETKRHLLLALNILSHIVYRNGSVLFIHCQPEYDFLTQQTARESGELFVSSQWIPGSLTNRDKLLNSSWLPDVAIFLSVKRDNTAVKEVAMCNIPSIAVVDTDCNPRVITYPIPGNDDSPTAVSLYCHLFKTAILNAKEKRQHMHAKQLSKSESNETEIL